MVTKVKGLCPQSLVVYYSAKSFDDLSFNTVILSIVQPTSKDSLI